MSINSDNLVFGGISAQELMENDFCDNSQSNIFVGNEKLEPFPSLPSDQKQEKEPIGSSEFDLVETPTIAPPSASKPKRRKQKFEALPNSDDDDDGNLIFSKHHESGKVRAPRIIKNGRIPGNYKCHQCDKVFPYKSHLDKHRSTHVVQDRSHLCDVCGKTYTKLEYLRCHKRLHTGEKEFECDKCEFKCNWRRNFVLHKRTHLRKPKCYKPNPKFKYICDDCEMRFRTPSQLGIHVRKHTGARPFGCNFCNKRFAHISNMVVHERRHTGEKPFVCDICGKGYPDPTHMKNHRRTHLGVGETESRSPSPTSSEESWD